MADLLVDRVTPNKPSFSSVGIDYFGPFEVKQGGSRVKRYGCLFTCLAMQAVHIEVAKNLDTVSIINALKKERRIEWIFNPPEVSSTEGTWERIIRSVRKIHNHPLQE